MDGKVLQETPDTLVEKVGHCKNIKCLIAKFSQRPDAFDNLKYLENTKFYSKAKKKNNREERKNTMHRKKNPIGTPVQG